MLKIDKAIADTNNIICKNILSPLRNLVEYIATKIYNNNSDPNDYEMKTKAIAYVKTRGEFRFLYIFHDLLQKSVYHYSFNEDGSERLLLKYYEHLIRVKNFLNKNFNFPFWRILDRFH